MALQPAAKPAAAASRAARVAQQVPASLLENAELQAAIKQVCSFGLWCSAFCRGCRNFSAALPWPCHPEVLLCHPTAELALLRNKLCCGRSHLFIDCDLHVAITLCLNLCVKPMVQHSSEHGGPSFALQSSSLADLCPCAFFNLRNPCGFDFGTCCQKCLSSSSYPQLPSNYNFELPKTLWRIQQKGAKTGIESAPILQLNLLGEKTPILQPPLGYPLSLAKISSLLPAAL